MNRDPLTALGPSISVIVSGAVPENVFAARLDNNSLQQSDFGMAFYERNLNEFSLNNPITLVDAFGFCYTDVNVTVGSPFGFGFTVGIMFGGGNGFHFYIGPAFSTPGGGAMVTQSKQNVTTGWNYGWSAAYGGAFQYGSSIPQAQRNNFTEWGIGTPGVSASMFYVF